VGGGVPVDKEAGVEIGDEVDAMRVLLESGTLIAEPERARARAA
jgi:hypothetical protein